MLICAVVSHWLALSIAVGEPTSARRNVFSWSSRARSARTCLYIRPNGVYSLRKDSTSSSFNIKRAPIC